MATIRRAKSAGNATEETDNAQAEFDLNHETGSTAFHSGEGVEAVEQDMATEPKATPRKRVLRRAPPRQEENGKRSDAQRDATPSQHAGFASARQEARSTGSDEQRREPRASSSAIPGFVRKQESFDRNSEESAKPEQNDSR
mgnify:CR=1 FL=1